MKTNQKEYLQKVELRQDLKWLMQQSQREENWKLYEQCKTDLRKLDEEYFDLVPKAFVSFLIGSRSYFHQVDKIGNGYFDHGRKMTKGRGYRCLTEIPEITDEMRDSMMSDSYYY